MSETVLNSISSLVGKSVKGSPRPGTISLGRFGFHTKLVQIGLLFALLCAPLSAITESQRDRAATLAAKIPGAYVGIVEPTGSMKPLFDAGDLLVIVPRDFDKIKAGDVIAFTTRGGVLAAHRAVRKDLGKWITKGDNCAIEDREPVSVLGLSGVVVAIVR